MLTSNKTPLTEERKVGRIMKKLFVTMLALVLVISCFAGCGAKKEASSDSDLAYIQEKGTLIVGITEYEPMDYKDADGKWIGFDADLASFVTVSRYHYGIERSKIFL